jgi:hypothetical protein
MGRHPEWERILDVGGDPGGKGSPAVGAGGSSEEGRGSEKKGPGLHRVTVGSKDWEATPKTFFGGRHVGSVAESVFRPEPTRHTYRKERGTGQAPCYAVERTVSPVRVHSPVRYIPTPHNGQARVGIQPGWCRLSAPGFQCISSAQDILCRLCALCLRCACTAQCVLC